MPDLRGMIFGIDLVEMAVMAAMGRENKCHYCKRHTILCHT